MTNVAEVIRLAVTPVFLLMAVGTFLSVLSMRLNRVVDRSRALEAAGAADHRHELDILKQRRRLVNVAITSGTLAALLISLVIALAFVGSLIKVDFSHVLAGLFVTAMMGFIGMLVAFLAEIRLALNLI